LNNLGVLAQGQGELDEAWRFYAEAAEYEQEQWHTFGVARALSNLGEVAEAKGNLEQAARLFAAAERLFEQVKSPYTSYVADLLASVVGKLGDGESVLDSMRREAKSKSPEELVAWATTGAITPL
jgi:ATP/maltotriose-dependent transcriptional regulator MalT